MKTHLYQPDYTNGPDHNGLYRCMCGLPFVNKVHIDPPETPAEDVSARIVGEGQKGNR